MIELIKVHPSHRGRTYREYLSRSEDEAKSFAHMFGGSYFKLMEDYYRILI